MNSDHVQRYHVQPDGVFCVENGEWIKVRDVKQYLKSLQRYDNQGEWVRFKDVEQLFRED